MPKRWTEAERAKLVRSVRKLYVQNHMTVRAIADHHGISYGTAWGMLHEAGVTFRARGGKVPAKARWGK